MTRGWQAPVTLSTGHTVLRRVTHQHSRHPAPRNSSSFSAGSPSTERDIGDREALWTRQSRREPVRGLAERETPAPPQPTSYGGQLDSTDEMCSPELTRAACLRATSLCIPLGSPNVEREQPPRTTIRLDPRLACWPRAPRPREGTFRRIRVSRKSRTSLVHSQPCVCAGLTTHSIARPHPRPLGPARVTHSVHRDRPPRDRCRPAHSDSQRWTDRTESTENRGKIFRFISSAIIGQYRPTLEHN